MNIYCFVRRIYLNTVDRIIALSEHKNFYMIIIKNSEDRDVYSICSVGYIDHILIQFMIHKHDHYVFNIITAMLSGKMYISFFTGFALEFKSCISHGYDISIIHKQISKHIEVISYNILHSFINIIFVCRIYIMIKVESFNQRIYNIFPDIRIFRSI